MPLKLAAVAVAQPTERLALFDMTLGGLSDTEALRRRARHGPNEPVRSCARSTSSDCATRRAPAPPPQSPPVVARAYASSC
jgi:hypothetical protein